MNHSLTFPLGRRLPWGTLAVLLIALLLITALYSHFRDAPPLAFAQSTTPTGLDFSYQLTTSDLTIDWSGGGDFDPRDKCPDDFFAAGFTLVCKKLPDGGSIKFLYHKGKKLLYRIDQDVIRGKTKIGLHWVTGTQFNAKYRIADKAYKGGRLVTVPNGKGGFDTARFQYGDAVSKRRARPGRELFKETHIDPKQCRSWWDLFNFMP
jgi:hypothetical protein